MSRISMLTRSSTDPLLAVLGAVVGGVVLRLVDGLFAGLGTWSSVSFIAD
jgi:hypothetical protein